VNFSDSKKRTALHLAVDAAKLRSDISFDIEELLISKGADVNQCDYLNRTPLHYAFVEIGKYKESSAIDPVETVRGLLSVKGIKLDLADKYGRTPLHYAAQRGSVICALELLRCGATLETKDKQGNTPLSIAFQYHSGMAITLLQKGADPSVFVFK
jgi:ankyrin repeat protein